MIIKSIKEWKSLFENRKISAYNQWHQQALDILDWSKNMQKEKNILKFDQILLEMVEEWFSDTVKEEGLTEFDIINHCDECLSNITKSKKILLLIEFNSQTKYLNEDILELEQSKKELFKEMELEAGIKKDWNDDDANRYAQQIETLEQQIETKKKEKNAIFSLLEADFEKSYNNIESYLYQNK